MNLIELSVTGTRLSESRSHFESYKKLGTNWTAVSNVDLGDSMCLYVYGGLKVVTRCQSTNRAYGS